MTIEDTKKHCYTSIQKYISSSYLMISQIPSLISLFLGFLIINLENLIDFGQSFLILGSPKLRLKLTRTLLLSSGKGFTVGSIPQTVEI